MLTQIPAVSTQPIHARRLIIASNRGPVEYTLSQDHTLKPRRGAGGLVTALIDAVHHMQVTWVAMAMTEGDRLALKQAQHDGGRLSAPLVGKKLHLHYVSIPKAAYRKYYEKISTQFLWFLQHYMHNPSEDAAWMRRVQDSWANGYCVANQAIAEAINAEIEREAGSVVVMLHDYHLYLAAALIRQAHPAVVIQQFIHIPWPDIRCWHFLPSTITAAIFRGLLGNDLIGFQTEQDARNFLEGARSLLEDADVDCTTSTIDWRGHTTRVCAYPISISVSGERLAVGSAAGRRASEKLLPLLGEKTIMRVDRIEPTKNIVRGFQAYRQLLEEHPELRGHVTFCAFLVPCRQGLQVYQRYHAEVLKIIEEINQHYGSQEWQPIQAFFGNDRIRALAAMQWYDVLLVNPIIDGMNLVAKEGPVVNQRHGVLVLSRTVGAFQQLGKFSIPTSPTDTSETAQALYQALTLSAEERRLKATLARQAVEHQDLNAWLGRQIHDLNVLLDRLAPQPESVDPLLPLLAATAG